MEKEKIYITERDLRNIVTKSIKKLVNTKRHNDGLFEFTEVEDIEKHSSEIWRIMQRSYSNIGGFLTYVSIDELINKTSLVIAYFLNNHIVACAIYKDALGGQKLVGCGTLNGTEPEKSILRDIIQSDIDNFNKWHWSEVSYPLEKWFKEMGGNPIPSDMATEILHITTKRQLKDFHIIDEVHYERLIRGEKLVKAIYGFKDLDTYNKVMERFDDYVGFKNKINGLPKLDEDYSYSNHTNPTISTAMEIIIQIDNLWEEGYREITPTMMAYLTWAIDYLEKCGDTTKRITNLIRNGKYMKDNLSVLSTNSLSELEAYITSPAT